MENRPDPASGSFQEASNAASHANYLGSPAVVGGLVANLFSACVENARQPNYQSIIDACNLIASAVSGCLDDYTVIPGWHTSDALGSSLVEYLDLDRTYYADENLYCICTEAMAGVGHKIREMLADFENDPKAEWARDGNPQLNHLSVFVVTVFLGTNPVYFPETRLASFQWQKVETEPK